MKDSLKKSTNQLASDSDEEFEAFKEKKHLTREEIESKKLSLENDIVILKQRLVQLKKAEAFFDKALE